MRSILPALFTFVAGCLLGAGFVPPKVITKTETVTLPGERVEVPGPTVYVDKPGPERVVEKVIHEPADTAELESLRSQLTTAQKELAAESEQLRYARGLLNQRATDCAPVPAVQTYQTRPRLFGRRKN